MLVVIVTAYMTMSRDENGGEPFWLTTNKPTKRLVSNRLMIVRFSLKLPVWFYFTQWRLVSAYEALFVKSLKMKTALFPVAVMLYVILTRNSTSTEVSPTGMETKNVWFALSQYALVALLSYWRTKPVTFWLAVCVLVVFRTIENPCRAAVSWSRLTASVLDVPGANEAIFFEFRETAVFGATIWSRRVVFR